MNVLKKIFICIISKPVALLRKAHIKKMKKRLKNQDFSIIASNCIGTFIYHDLGLRFDSPTINLFFRDNDFIKFVSHLKEYLSAELEEIEDEKVSYPVGILTYNNESVRIDFMHYHSFKEAKEKWNERKKRINFSNLYIIQLKTNNITQEYLDTFAALPYKHKMLVTYENDFTCDCMVTHKILSDKNYRHGRILEYKSIFASSRYMDDLDYISFLNQK